MTIEIDKGVPVPDDAGTAGVKKYPWAEMADGDSFFVPVLEGQTATQVQASIVSSSRKVCRRVTRTVTENGVLGVRAWRVP